MISVAEALEACFALAPEMPAEQVPLNEAAGRILIAPVTAPRSQPPFAASAMDGYAVRDADVAPGAVLTVTGISRAGEAASGRVDPGTAIRIFTGAPVPPGADRVVIQEDVTQDGDRITLGETLDSAHHIRPAGTDFAEGAVFDAPKRLAAADLALLAAMNQPDVTCARRPVVAIIASGDELVWPGEAPGPDQIICSNSYAIAAIAQAEGAEARLLPIARDNPESIRFAFGLVGDADVIVTSGGASVGDHDLIGPVAREIGMEQSFYKVAMRPGKPLMAGRLGGAMVLGLPGNPVSSIVCAHVFLRPILRAMQGLPARALPRQTAALADPMGKNGPREHYMRAILGEDGRISAAERQDSSLLWTLAASNALIVRPPDEGPRETGETVEFISI